MRVVIQSEKRRLFCLPGAGTSGAEIEAVHGLRPQKRQNGWLELPHNDHVVATLNDAGTSAPAPISMYYDWRGMAPFAHQRVSAEFLTTHKRAFNLSDIGTGKTLSALWAMDWLIRSGAVKRALIVAPKSTINVVWSRELFKHFHNRSVEVLIGTAEQRRERLAKSPQIAIINHDGIKVMEEELIAAKFDLVIVDESTALKSHGTERWRAFSDIVKHGCRLWLMTGTPTPQLPTDIYGQARLVCPTAIPGSFHKTREILMFKVGQFKWLPKRGAERIIRNWIAPHTIRFTLDECVELPDERSAEIECEATTEQVRIEADLRREAVSLIESEGVITAVNEGVLVSKLLQTACGAVIYDSMNGKADRTVDCQPKLDQLGRIVSGSNGPVLVFCPFRAPLKMLSKWCETEGHPYAIVDGDTSQPNRVKAFDGVQSGEIKVLIANPETMAHGITLTASNVVVWWGLPFKRESYIQASGRIKRIGQKRKMYFVHLLSTPIEKIIYKRLQEGLALQGALMELLQRG